MVNTEIERRWLLKKFPSFLHEIEAIDIYQFYLKENDEIVRYRLENRGVVDYIYDQKYLKIIKKNISHGVNTEEILSINPNEFIEKMRAVKDKVIHKKRYIYYDKEQDLKFELDKFTHFSLIILEVELEDITQEFEILPEIKKEIIIEITGMKEFSNYNLSL